MKVSVRLARYAQYVLFAAGVCALGYCLTVILVARHYQRDESRALDVTIRHSLAKTIPAKLPPPAPIDGETLGRLTIPSIGLRVMVVEGDSEQDLLIGAGHIPGTALPDGHGNFGVAAHRDTFFRPLRNIRKNDVIHFTSQNGEFTYRVASLTIVDPHDVQVLNPTGQDSLTLVTCYPFYYVGAAPKRFIVHAIRES
jgi:sortase A